MFVEHGQLHTSFEASAQPVNGGMLCPMSFAPKSVDLQSARWAIIAIVTQNCKGSVWYENCVDLFILLASNKNPIVIELPDLPSVIVHDFGK